MTDNDPQESDRPKDDLAERLSKARQASRPPQPKKGGLSDPSSGIGAAMRIGTEMVATLIVAVAIGYGLDRWLDTKPWFMVGFFFFGAVAGIMNVYRSAEKIGAAPQTSGDSDEMDGT